MARPWRQGRAVSSQAACLPLGGTADVACPPPRPGQEELALVGWTWLPRRHLLPLTPPGDTASQPHGLLTPCSLSIC